MSARPITTSTILHTLTGAINLAKRYIVHRSRVEPNAAVIAVVARGNFPYLLRTFFVVGFSFCRGTCFLTRLDFWIKIYGLYFWEGERRGSTWIFAVVVSYYGSQIGARVLAP